MSQRDKLTTLTRNSECDGEIDSYVFLSFAGLDGAEPHLSLNTSGPNGVRDVLLQIYRADEWLSRAKKTFLEFGTSFFQFETDEVAAGKKVSLASALAPLLDNPVSPNLAIQFLTQTESYFQLLLHDGFDGKMMQGQIVFSVESTKTRYLRMHFDSRFPEGRQVQVKNRIVEWTKDGNKIELRRDKLKAQFPRPSLW